MLENLFPGSKQSPSPSDDLLRASRTVVHPCLYQGEPTIFIERGLKDKDPESFARHLEFAQAHGIRIREERRTKQLEVPNQRRRNSLSFLVLGLGLYGSTATAGDTNSHGGTGLFLGERPAAYAAPSDEYVMKELLAWLGNQDLGLDVSWRPPKLKRVSHDKLVKLAFGKDLPAARDKDNLALYGLYNFNNDTIYLLDKIDLGNEPGRSILVHELVHYVQYQEGVNNRVRCKNELEALAYKVEAQYLEQHRHRAGFSAADVRGISRCS